MALHHTKQGTDSIIILPTTLKSLLYVGDLGENTCPTHVKKLHQYEDVK